MRITLASILPVVFGWCLGWPLQAAPLFSLSFDKLERTPVTLKVLPDLARPDTAIQMSDSAKLVKGVKDLGIYLEHTSDYLSFSGAGNIRSEQGALAFWFRPMWAPNDGRDKIVFSAWFEKGAITLWNNQLWPLVTDTAGKIHYPPQPLYAADNSRWQTGEWHHVVFNWATNGCVQLIIDGAPRPAFWYPAPAGKATTVLFSPAPTVTDGRFPGCGVIDEVEIYDAPLGTNEIAALYEDGRKALGDFKPGPTLEISLYPNLAKNAELTMDPKPNFGPPVYANVCNDSNDVQQLSDGDWHEAFYGDLRSVGWTATPKITLDYDLGTLKTVGALACQIGGGNAGDVFPAMVTYWVGPTREQMRKVGQSAKLEPYPNPQYPKWHARRVGVDHLDYPARFVRFEFQGGLFIDEVMIVEKNAQPVLMIATPAVPIKKPVAQEARPMTNAVPPPASSKLSVSERPWRWALTAAYHSPAAGTNAPAKPQLVFQVEAWGGETNRRPVKANLAYKSAMLVRGKTDYTRGHLAKPEYVYNGAMAIDYELRTVTAGQQEVALQADDKGVIRGMVTVDVTNQPFGVCYLDATLLDEGGRELSAVKHRKYDVSVELPRGVANDINGYDNYSCWTAMPSPQQREYWLHSEFIWIKVNLPWSVGHLKPGEIICLDYLDRWVDMANSNGSPMMVSLADALPDFLAKADTPTVLAAYREWAEALISRWKDKKMIKVWDVWNEPDSKPYALQDDRDIAAIKIVYELKEKYCPQTRVTISPHTKAGLNYLKRILDKGAGKYLGGVGVHPYRGLAPEIPETDGFSGNPSGVCTFAEELANAHQLLLDYKVTSADVYITENNYLMNSLHQYDDNDNVNFMIRCHILARTLPYVRSYMNHATGLGRFLPAALPNLVLQLMDTTFIKRVPAGDEQIHAYLFSKKDGREILPVWSVKYPKVVQVSGLKGAPGITDLYGNPVAFTYDAAAGALDFITVSQTPIYITAPAGSQPVICRQNRLEVSAPGELVRGKTAAVCVAVKSLPARRGAIALQADSSWSITPEQYTIEKTGDYVFQIRTSTNNAPGRHPVVVEFKDEQGKALDMEAVELALRLPVAERDKRFGFVVASDFESGSLADWRVEKSAQSEIGVVQDGSRKVLRIEQKHIDLAAALSRETSPVVYGVLEFEIKPSVQKQSFEVQYGAVRLGFDGKGGLRLLGENGKSRELGAYQPDIWQTVRVFFAAPEGWCRLWLGDKYRGQFEVPVAGDGFRNLRLMAGTVQTPAPAVFLLDNLKVVEVKPVVLGSGEPLAWTICGPFPNVVDPKTMKRPYEIDMDYLAPVGGLINLDPYPGMAVPVLPASPKPDGGGGSGPVVSAVEPVEGTGNGTTNMFQPFYPAKGAYGGVDFFMVKDLGLYPEQGNILCYAACYVISPEEKKVTIGVGSDDWCALWVNHKLMGKACGWPIGRNVRPDSEKYPVTLRKGLNLLLMCVDQGDGGFMFFCGME